MRLSGRYYQKISDEVQWDSPLTTMQKPTYRQKQPRELAKDKASRGVEKIAHGWSRGTGSQTPTTHTTKRLLANSDKFGGITPCSQNAECNVMTWPTRPYLTSWIRPAIGNRLYTKIPSSSNGLLRASSIWEIDLKSILNPLWDGMTTPKIGSDQYLWADAWKIPRRLLILHLFRRWLYTKSLGLLD